MSTQRTPPESSLLKPNILTQESDTASDYVGSDPDCRGQINITRRFKRKFDDSTLTDIKEMLANVQQQQIAQASKLDTEMNKMIKQNTDIKTSIETMSDKYDEILQELKQTKAENTAIKKQMKLFEQKIELLERNAKASTLELRNIPEQQSENKSTLVSLVKNIGEQRETEYWPSEVSRRI
ncbi:unnamed protein product [Arctia plantaginis]|uniref:Uncharacterized protein n=1 Tax=Arctia plantaginis TaxID=874455 RepID=A0A8S1B0X8_ARCPL|nr:unnamed protein product [Arctia plantaginis]